MTPHLVSNAEVMSSHPPASALRGDLPADRQWPRSRLHGVICYPESRRRA
jgi:hypothetical protein